MSPANMWKFFGCLGLAFGLPWLLLVVIPFISMSNAAPTQYSEEDGAEGLTQYPDTIFFRNGNSDYGAQIYAEEGCAYCHTQMIRPTYAGPDMWRDGWGGRKDFARETRPEDYTGEGVAYLGYSRIGQDLSNVGYRVSSREEMHRHLYDPKSFDANSGMPAYLHLYKKNSVTGEYYPTGKAEALVDYLMSRKKDAPIPASKK